MPYQYELYFYRYFQIKIGGKNIFSFDQKNIFSAITHSANQKTTDNSIMFFHVITKIYNLVQRTRNFNLHHKIFK